MATQAAAEANPFPFPPEYAFPAFFSRQENISTHRAQLERWSAIVLNYARHHGIFRLSVSAAAESDLFHNRRLDRRLQLPDIRDLLDFMRKEGRAEYVSGEGGGAAATGGDVVFIYWRKPEEWGRLIERYVEETGQKGTVLTLYELVEGEGTRGAEFHGMDSDVLQKALQHLVKRGRAQVFGQDGSQGVKFFG